MNYRGNFQQNYAHEQLFRTDIELLRM